MREIIREEALSVVDREVGRHKKNSPLMWYLLSARRKQQVYRL